MGSLRKIEKNMGAMNMNILRTLIAMVVILALPISGVAQDNEKEAGAAAADVARYWIQIGAKQYEKGFYLPAEQVDRKGSLSLHGKKSARGTDKDRR
ncbi:MAG: hypothetical protein ACYTBP_02265 [Planctomycetota bacterium]